MIRLMTAHRIGALFFALWGLLHVLGGFAMLNTLHQSGGPGYLQMIATASPGLPTATDPASETVFGFHAFNLIWLGLLVLVIALTLNWNNSMAGYWINLSIVTAADLGLVLFLLLPGYMALAEGWPGPVLLLLAGSFSTLGVLQRTRLATTSLRSP